MKELFQSALERDAEELREFRDNYVSEAGLAKDAGLDKTARAYMQTVLLLEQVIQQLGTIPHLGELPES